MKSRYMAIGIALALTACTPEGEDGDIDGGVDVDGGGVDGGGVDGGGVEPASYAETVMAAAWASDMTLSLEGDTLTIGDDGIPDRGVLEGYASPMGGDAIVVLESAYEHEISMAPALAAETTEAGMGTIGVSISGGLLFNPYEGNGDLALDGNFDVDGVPFLDPCNGHPLPDGSGYHYHGVPYCIADAIDTEGEHSKLLGLLLDGFPVYGPRGEGGEAATDLDDCNGHAGATPEFPDGIYHYHTTETAPYIMRCYAGEVEVTGGGGPGGGGPGGGGPGGGGPPG